MYEIETLIKDIKNPRNIALSVLICLFCMLLGYARGSTAGLTVGIIVGIILSLAGLIFIHKHEEKQKEIRDSLIIPKIGMTEKKEQITEIREFGKERIEVAFKKAADPDAPESRYPGFNPGTSTLKKGTVVEEGALPLPCDIIFERDVAIPLRDGIIIYADIFRPVDGKDLPAIISWSPFGKGGGMCLDDFPGRAGVPRDATSGLEAWEAPDHLAFGGSLPLW